MNIIENQKIYVLTIVDEGNVQFKATATSPAAIKKIAQKSIRAYLMDRGIKVEGTKELVTLSGYAIVSKTELNGYAQAERIFTYFFNGEEPVETALEKI